MYGIRNFAGLLLLCAFEINVGAGQDMTSLIHHIHSLNTRNNLNPHYSRYTHKRETTDNFCNNFALKSRFLSIGDELKKVGIVNSDQSCIDACTMEAEFYCVSAMLRLGNMCFLSGFKPRSNYYSTQYYKICEKGDGCFAQERGVSLGYSSTHQFPEWMLSRPAKVKVTYCQALCENLHTCIGVALRETKDRCYLTTLDILPNNNFDLYVRQCAPQ